MGDRGLYWNTLYTYFRDKVTTDSTKQNERYYIFLGQVLSKFDFKLKKASLYNSIEEKLKDFDPSKSNSHLDSETKYNYLTLGKQAYQTVLNVSKFYGTSFNSKRDLNKAKLKEYEKLQDLLG